MVSRRGLSGRFRVSEAFVARLTVAPGLRLKAGRRTRGRGVRVGKRRQSVAGAPAEYLACGLQQENAVLGGMKYGGRFAIFSR